MSTMNISLRFKPGPILRNFQYNRTLDLHEETLIKFAELTRIKLIMIQLIAKECKFIKGIKMYKFVFANIQLRCVF